MIEMSAVYEEAPPPHRGGFNVLYADGHVKWTAELPRELKMKKESAKESAEEAE